MPRRLRFVLGDQLTLGLSSLEDLDPVADIVLMAEVQAEATYVGHHKQKIAFLFSAMRHFAQALHETGIAVDYVRIDDASNTQSFTGELKRAVARHTAKEVIVTAPGEWRVLDMMRGWQALLGLPVDTSGASHSK